MPDYATPVTKTNKPFIFETYENLVTFRVNNKASLEQRFV